MVIVRGVEADDLMGDAGGDFFEALERIEHTGVGFGVAGGAEALCSEEVAVLDDGEAWESSH